VRRWGAHVVVKLRVIRRMGVVVQPHSFLPCACDGGERYQGTLLSPTDRRPSGPEGRSGRFIEQIQCVAPDRNRTTIARPSRPLSGRYTD